MKKARILLRFLNKHIFDKMGFRIILASSEKRTMAMAREMERSNYPSWVKFRRNFKSPYTLRSDGLTDADPLDYLYDFYQFKVPQEHFDLIKAEILADIRKRERLITECKKNDFTKY